MENPVSAAAPMFSDGTWGRGEGQGHRHPWAGTVMNGLLVSLWSFLIQVNVIPKTSPQNNLSYLVQLIPMQMWKK